MEWFDHVNISERFMEIINPSSPAKILTVGQFLRLRTGRRVLDFGCGFAEPLVLWAERYGISGVGVDVRPYACERSRRKIEERGLADRLSIVCARGSAYKCTETEFDAATCIGTTFVFGGFRETLVALRQHINEHGRLAVGEPYWAHTDVPPVVADAYTGIWHEHELLAMIRAEGFELAGRSTSLRPRSARRRLRL